MRLVSKIGERRRARREAQEWLAARDPEYAAKWRMPEDIRKRHNKQIIWFHAMHALIFVAGGYVIALAFEWPAWATLTRVFLQMTTLWGGLWYIRFRQARYLREIGLEKLWAARKGKLETMWENSTTHRRMMERRMIKMAKTLTK